MAKYCSDLDKFWTSSSLLEILNLYPKIKSPFPMPIMELCHIYSPILWRHALSSNTSTYQVGWQQFGTDSWHLTGPASGWHTKDSFKTSLEQATWEQLLKWGGEGTKYISRISRSGRRIASIIIILGMYNYRTVTTQHPRQQQPTSNVNELRAKSNKNQRDSKAAHRYTEIHIYREATRSGSPPDASPAIISPDTSTMPLKSGSQDPSLFCCSQRRVFSKWFQFNWQSLNLT